MGGRRVITWEWRIVYWTLHIFYIYTSYGITEGHGLYWRGLEERDGAVFGFFRFVKRGSSYPCRTYSSLHYQRFSASYPHHVFWSSQGYTTNPNLTATLLVVQLSGAKRSVFSCTAGSMLTLEIQNAEDLTSPKSPYLYRSSPAASCVSLLLENVSSTLSLPDVDALNVAFTLFSPPVSAFPASLPLSLKQLGVSPTKAAIWVDRTITLPRKLRGFPEKYGNFRARPSHLAVLK